MAVPSASQIVNTRIDSPLPHSCYDPGIQTIPLKDCHLHRFIPKHEEMIQHTRQLFEESVEQVNHATFGAKHALLELLKKTNSSENIPAKCLIRRLLDEFKNPHKPSLIQNNSDLTKEELQATKNKEFRQAIHRLPSYSLVFVYLPDLAKRLNDKNQKDAEILSIFFQLCLKSMLQRLFQVNRNVVIPFLLMS